MLHLGQASRTSPLRGITWDIQALENTNNFRDIGERFIHSVKSILKMRPCDEKYVRKNKKLPEYHKTLY